MRFKGIMLMTFLLLAILTMASASANDLADADEGIFKVSPSDIIELGDADDDVISSADEDDDNGTFTDLQKKINLASPGSTIVLKHDYSYDENFTDPGILVNKTLTIDGKGHAIDGKSQYELFTLKSPVVFKNVSFKNSYKVGRYFGQGSAIMNEVSCILESCNFTNCYAQEEGGAIFNCGGSYCKITSCNFINCSARYGGAIYGGGFNHEMVCIIDSCNFVDCRCVYNGGAICILRTDRHVDANCTITSSNFVNCYGMYCGAIYNDNAYPNLNLRIGSCDFFNCTCDDENDGGGAIYNTHAGCSQVVDCAFYDYVTTKEAVNVNTTLAGCVFKHATKEDIDYFNSLRNVKKPTFEPVIATSVASKVTYKAGSKYGITVYGADGKPANNTYVVVTVDGKKFKTIKTDEKGVVKFEITQEPGKHKIQITALGKTVTGTIDVKHLVSLKQASVKKSAKSLTLQVNLGKVNGKYLSGKQVTFKFNGKTYKAKTNSKGVAKCTVKSSVLSKLKVGKKVTYQATYLKDTVKKTVTVKK